MANGCVLTPTPIRSTNSIGKSNGSITNKNHPSNGNNGVRLNNGCGETEAPSGVNGLSDKGIVLGSSRKKVIASNCGKYERNGVGGGGRGGLIIHLIHNGGSLF